MAIPDERYSAACRIPRPITLTYPATFFTPAVVALMDKSQTREIVEKGHEVGMHGWIHANNSRLDGDASAGLVGVPVEWVRDDAVYLSFNRSSARPLLSPDDVFTIFRRELDAAAAEGDVFQLLMHPHIIGHRSRVWIIDELIKHARSLGGAWFGTHAQVAQWARDNAV